MTSSPRSPRKPFIRNTDANMLEIDRKFQPHAFYKISELSPYTKSIEKTKCTPSTSPKVSTTRPTRTIENSSDISIFPQKLRESYPGIPIIRSYEFSDEIIPIESLHSTQNTIKKLYHTKNKKENQMTHETNDKIILHWLSSLQEESKKFTSYFLYCEMLFQQTSVMVDGKVFPNRLRTAVALHCLYKASSIFGRYQDILKTICNDLGSAIYIDYYKLIKPNDIGPTAMDVFQNGFCYFDHSIKCMDKINQMTETIEKLTNENNELHQEIEKLNKSIVSLRKATIVGHEFVNNKVKDKPDRILNNGKNILKKQPSNIHKSVRLSTQSYGLGENLIKLTQLYQSLDLSDRKQVAMSIINTFDENMDFEMMSGIMTKMNLDEKNKLIQSLMKEQKDKIERGIQLETMAHTFKVRQSVIVEKAIDRFLRFQAIIKDILSGIHISAIDIPLEDKELIELIGGTVDNLHQKKVMYNELELSYNELEKENKNIMIQMNQELNIVKDELNNIQKLYNDLNSLYENTKIELNNIYESKKLYIDFQMQVDENMIFKATGFNKDRKVVLDGYDFKLNFYYNNDDTKLNHFTCNIVKIINQSKLTTENIKKIISKKKIPSIEEFHSIIAGIYQSKILQDIQDDNSLKLRSNLSIYLRDMYTIQYGLKSIALNQLLYLDTAIKKYASESSRVRIFGLLCGSLEPNYFSSSIQAIDFFLFTLGICFNVGHYQKDKLHAISNAKKIKEFMGININDLEQCFYIKIDRMDSICDIIFSFTTIDMNLLKKELYDDILIKSDNKISLDFFLERVMMQWFRIYEEEVNSIYILFNQMDKNQDGTLDFNEFYSIVLLLDPNINERECLNLYNKVSGEDGLIDKEEFVIAMLSYQRESILTGIHINKDHSLSLHELDEKNNNKKTISSILFLTSTHLDTTVINNEMISKIEPTQDIKSLSNIAHRARFHSMDRTIAKNEKLFNNENNSNDQILKNEKNNNDNILDNENIQNISVHIANSKDE